MDPTNNAVKPYLWTKNKELVNKLLVPVIVGILIAVSATLLLYDEDSPEPAPIYDSGFTYYDIEAVRTALAEHDITVSTPIAITDDTIDSYCLYFDGIKPQSVSYCTTTVIRTSDGNTLGNINLGGDADSPILAIVNIETSTLESRQTEVFAVFDGVIESLVCNCWEEQSEEFETTASWFEAAQDFYLDSGMKNVKSRISGLEGTELILEITSRENSVLRTLIVLK